MHLVSPKVYCIGRSIVDCNAIREWLSDLGVSKDRVTALMIESANNPTESIVALAGRRCYNSYEPGLNPNVTKVRTDFSEYIENILNSGHGSVTEHIYVSFALEGVSRVFTAEMNRHRAGVGISEASMRYIRFEDIGFWMPESIKESPVSKECDNQDDIPSLSIKKIKTQAIFKESFQQAEDAYKKLLSIWSEELEEGSSFTQKKALTSMMRRIIPMGVSTGGVWTANLRAWRHIVRMRTEKFAEEEIRLVLGMIYDQLSVICPNILIDSEKKEDGTVAFKNPKI